MGPSAEAEAAASDGIITGIDQVAERDSGLSQAPESSEMNE